MLAYLFLPPAMRIGATRKPGPAASLFISTDVSLTNLHPVAASTTSATYTSRTPNYWRYVGHPFQSSNACMTPGPFRRQLGAPVFEPDILAPSFSTPTLAGTGTMPPRPLVAEVRARL